MKSLMVILAAAGFSCGLGCDDRDDRPGPPPAPADLVQLDDLHVPIPPGGNALEGTLRFEATLATAAPTMYVALQVRVFSVNQPRSFSASAMSEWVPDGCRTRVDFSGIPEGSYGWCAETLDQQGLRSPQADFRGPSDIDFTVDPSKPSEPRQFRLDAALVLPPGGETPEVGVILQARVHSTSGMLVHAQFEVKPAGVAFDGEGLQEGSPVQVRRQSNATVRVTPGPFHWRVRTEAYDSTRGPWLEYQIEPEVAPPATDFTRVPADSPPVPQPPVDLGQLHTDLLTALPVGGTSGESQVAFRGTTPYDPLELVALEFEVKPVGIVFDGNAALSTGFVLGGYAATACLRLPAEAHHWRSRTLHALGGTSEWVAFGSNLDGVPADADFILNGPTAWFPQDPKDLSQRRLNGSTLIPAGSALSESGFIAQGTVLEAGSPRGLVLEVEVRSDGAAFFNVPTAVGSLAGTGGVSRAEVTDLKSGRLYRWQARTKDSEGETSAWVTFVNNPVSTTGSSGSSGGGSGYGGGLTGGGCASVSVAGVSGAWPALWAAVLGLLVVRRRPGAAR